MHEQTKSFTPVFLTSKAFIALPTLIYLHQAVINHIFYEITVLHGNISNVWSFIQTFGNGKTLYLCSLNTTVLGYSGKNTGI